jgi:hypothetical protein
VSIINQLFNKGDGALKELNENQKFVRKIGNTVIATILAIVAFDFIWMIYKPF